MRKEEQKKTAPSATVVPIESVVEVCALVLNRFAVDIRGECDVMGRSLDALQKLLPQLPQVERESALWHADSLKSTLQKFEELAQCLTRSESWN